MEWSVHFEDFNNVFGVQNRRRILCMVPIYLLLAVFAGSLASFNYDTSASTVATSQTHLSSQYDDDDDDDAYDDKNDNDDNDNDDDAMRCHFPGPRQARAHLDTGREEG